MGRRWRDGSKGGEGEKKEKLGRERGRKGREGEQEKEWFIGEIIEDKIRDLQKKSVTIFLLMIKICCECILETFIKLSKLIVLEVRSTVRSYIDREVVSYGKKRVD